MLVLFSAHEMAYRQSTLWEDKKIERSRRLFLRNRKRQEEKYKYKSSSKVEFVVVVVFAGGSKRRSTIQPTWQTSANKVGNLEKRRMRIFSSLGRRRQSQRRCRVNSPPLFYMHNIHIFLSRWLFLLFFLEHRHYWVHSLCVSTCRLFWPFISNNIF